MTLSIAACCIKTRQMGAAAVTEMNAVGKLACHAKAGIGAVVTQATVNPYLGYDGLRLLEKGHSAKQVLDLLIPQDPEPQIRQVGVVDRQGHTAAWSGGNILDWAGHRQGRLFTAQGNRLAGSEVLAAVVRSMNATESRPLAERLLLALEAGVAAGGDAAGESSGNIIVFDTEEYPLWDIRVDDHQKPVSEMRRLFHLFEDQLLPHILKMPKRTDFPSKAQD
jgi:uncharacterized Ntn-hydrolase superfamily protein